MKVIGFCGRSGSGKTTLIERVIPLMRAAGHRVSVLKHAHHDFDIDHPGKDSWRHRQAGAFEVIVASNKRLAIVREYEVEADTTVYQMLAELSLCDWVFVEGFKHADLPKIEVWRAAAGHPVQYPVDPFIVAVATDSPPALPDATSLPVLNIDDAQSVVQFLLSDPARYEYQFPDDPASPAADA